VHAKHSRIPEESGDEVRAKFQSTSNTERLAGSARSNRATVNHSSLDVPQMKSAIVIEHWMR
jgi:hypothetical protein